MEMFPLHSNIGDDSSRDVPPTHQAIDRRPSPSLAPLKGPLGPPCHAVGLPLLAGEPGKVPVGEPGKGLGNRHGVATEERPSEECHQMVQSNLEKSIIMFKNP